MAAQLSGDELARVLAGTLQALLPPGTACAVHPVGGPEWLMPAEQRLAAAMAPARRREFSTGRACAREALTLVGCPAADLPVEHGRAPAWPPPWVGSISHTRTVAAAVASRSLRAIGIDIEDDAPLEPDLAARICRPGELPEGQAEAGRLAKRIFSAKESVYKCLWPVSRRFIDFHELSIDPRDGHAFGVAGHGLDSLPVMDIQGRWVTVSGLVLTVAWLATGHCNPA